MIVASLLFVALAVSQDDDTWETLAPKGAGFAVELPAVPQEGGETRFVGPGGAGTLRQALRHADDVIYDVKLYQCERPIARGDEARWLDYVRDQESGFGAHGTVGAEKAIKLGAVAGREFLFPTRPQGGTANHETKGRAYIKGSNVYVLIATSRKGLQPLPPDADRFFESFAFAAKPSPAGKAAARKAADARDEADARIPNTWKPSTLLEGKSTAALPREPSQRYFGGNFDPPLEGFFSQTQIAETAAADYAIVVIRNEHGKAPPANDNALAVARERALSQFGTEGKVASDEPIATDAAGAGREFTLAVERGPKGPVAAKGRIYAAKEAIYVLVAVAKAKGKPPLPAADVDRFLGSLALTPPAGETARAVTLGIWGRPIDPDGDVAFTPSGRSLKVEIPGKPHVLAPERSIMNAPRVVAPIQGDFTATVRVDGPFQPGRESTVKGLSSRQAAGLVIWKDAENYLVLQRRAAFDDGEVAHRIVLEELAGGRKGVTLRQPAPEGPVVLRLERRKGRITASFAADGKAWQAMKPVDTDWAVGPAEVGTVAVSTSTGPHVVTFDDYTLEPR